jgi:hypothetical protein
MKGTRKNWIAGAVERPGAFTAKAKARGLSVAAFAAKVRADPDRYDGRTVKQANLAKTLREMSRK